ncbi:hypothetical protein PIB30_099352 [Stylosanthes scabra]|uniref:F-box domain-containing protein n=1 Tax=Stylosanthes scabra TaxID=79078 RepID=A0ABU6YUI6_9FABA|nr:hypothetical protein [Stylosanthes scabra]
MEKKHRSMNDILPVDLIQRIFLKLPAKQLGRLRRVSRLWHSLISDPHFAQSHLNLQSATPSPSCLFVKASTKAFFGHLDPLNNVSSASASAPVTEVPLPFKTKKHSEFRLMGCCIGFFLLNRETHFLVIWNPLTGSSKRISYFHIVSRSNRDDFMFPADAILYGFGYDDSQDDYLSSSLAGYKPPRASTTLGLLFLKNRFLDYSLFGAPQTPPQTLGCLEALAILWLVLEWSYSLVASLSSFKH